MNDREFEKFLSELLKQDASAGTEEFRDELLARCLEVLDTDGQEVPQAENSARIVAFPRSDSGSEKQPNTTEHPEDYERVERPGGSKHPERAGDYGRSEDSKRSEDLEDQPVELSDDELDMLAAAGDFSLSDNFGNASIFKETPFKMG